MSLDFYITAPVQPTHRAPCPHCGQMMTVTPELEELFSANITHNLTRMWREAGVFDALYESEGKRAADIVGALTEGVATMAREPDRFHAFSAPNKWGTYEQALPWLERVREACIESPYGVIHISR